MLFGRFESARIQQISQYNQLIASHRDTSLHPQLVSANMRNSIYSITLNEALAAVGGHGKYQQRSLALCSLLCFSAGASAGSLSFLLQKPLLVCASDPCSQVCDSPQVNPASAYTPAVEWGLICEREYLRDILGVLYLLGAAVGAMLLSSLEGCFGRRKVGCIAAFVGVLAGLMTSGSPYFELLLATAPWKGAADASLITVAALLVLETTEGEYRNWYLAGLFAAGSTGYLVVCLGGVVLTHWRSVALISTIAYCCCLPLTSLLHESPRYLSAIKGKYLQARSVLQLIAAANQKPPFNDMLEGEKVIGYQQESEENHLSNSSTRDATGKLVFVPITKGIVSVSQRETRSVTRYRFWHLLSLASCRGLFVVGLVTWASLALSYSSLWAVPGDTITAVALGMWAGDLVVLLLTAYLVRHVGRLGLSIAYLAIGGLSAILTVAFLAPNCHPQGLCDVERVIEILLLHSARVITKAEAYLLALYTLESFPTNIRFLAVGQYISTSALIWLICPLIADVLRAGQVSILLLCGVGQLICSIISCLLSDVDIEELQDFVEEEKSEMSKPAELSQIEIHPSSAEETSRRLKSTEPQPFQPIPEEEHSQEANKDTP